MSDTTCIPIETRDTLDHSIHKLRALNELISSHNGEGILSNFSLGIHLLFSDIEDQLKTVLDDLNKFN